MAGRKAKYEQEVLLKKASEIFWEKGYSNCSTSDLLSALDINKGTLYNFFGSKQKLFIQCLSYLEDDSFNQVENNIKSSETPFDVIADIFYSICTEDEKKRQMGCVLGNTLIESANTNKELAAFAEQYLLRLKGLFLLGINSAISKGQVTINCSPDQAALVLLNFWNGIQITKRLPYTEKDLKGLISAQFKSIINYKK